MTRLAFHTLHESLLVDALRHAREMTRHARSPKSRTRCNDGETA